MKHIRQNITFLAAILLLIGFSCRTMAQKVRGRSERLRPTWIHTGNLKKTNESFDYIVVTDQGRSLESLKSGRTANLSNYLEQTNRISGIITRDVNSVHSSPGGLESTTTHRLTFETQTEVIEFTSKMIDDYWEYTVHPDGVAYYHYYVLYAISKPGSVPDFDDVTGSTRYGAGGFLRSFLVPGWGQLYKGSASKGWMILGGEVVCAGGILYTENLRASYLKKIGETHNADRIRTYADMADRMETGRNICIGAAGALYVYNLIDAIASPGAKRIVHGKSKRYAYTPVVTTGYTGIKLAINF